MDGWGIAPPSKGNAITSASTPNFDFLQKNYPHSRLLASEESVGLPKGEFGNSETGHLNLGAGYIVPQDVVIIDRAIADGSFFKKKALADVFSHVENYHSNLHIIGLLSEAKVHSSLNHILALLRAAKDRACTRVHLHLFTDGRDSAPDSALSYLKLIDESLKKFGFGQIESLIGRFYAMDRDKRWLRTEQAYNLLTAGEGDKIPAVQEAIIRAYKRKETDEFISPTSIDSERKRFVPIGNNDGVIFFNFRFDRPRQLTEAFVNPRFSHFKRKKNPQNLFFITMTPYSKDMAVSGTIFPHLRVENPLARVISQHGLTQFHLAESEKFPHVTYFFNGGQENPFDREQWIEVPSPKVSTYDQKPEMSAVEVTEILLERIATGKYNFILANYANPDMVGHTGDLKAARKAISVVDKSLGQVISAVLEQKGFLLVTSDHGNAEIMINSQTGAPDTAHNISPVPCIAVAPDLKDNSDVHLSDGVLADIAPTILAALGISQPAAMTGKNLLAED